MSQAEVDLAKNGLGVSVGLFIAFYGAETLYWSDYMSANPDVTHISTTFGFFPFYAMMFIVGVTIAYVFFVRGFAAYSK